MRQQLLNPAGPMRGQAREHILQVGIRVVPVHARRLHQAHHHRRPLARTQVPGEQPVVSPNRNRPDLVLDPVVVHGQLPVINEARQRSPTPQAVVQRRAELSGSCCRCSSIHSCGASSNGLVCCRMALR